MGPEGWGARVEGGRLWEAVRIGPSGASAWGVAAPPPPFHRTRIGGGAAAALAASRPPTAARGPPLAMRATLPAQRAWRTSSSVPLPPLHQEKERKTKTAAPTLSRRTHPGVGPAALFNCVVAPYVTTWNGAWRQRAAGGESGR